MGLTRVLWPFCHCMQWFTATRRNAISFLCVLLSGNAQEKASDARNRKVSSAMCHFIFSWRRFTGSCSMICGFQGKRSATTSAPTETKFMHLALLRVNSLSGEIKHGYWEEEEEDGEESGVGETVFLVPLSADYYYCICTSHCGVSYLNLLEN